MTTFHAGRVYDSPEETDGARVLVDRLWPRGLSKDRAALDLWAKEVTPSDELRRWYHANPAAYEEFAARYRDELDRVPGALDRVRGAGEVVTLLTARAELEHSHVTVLLDLLS